MIGSTQHRTLDAGKFGGGCLSAEPDDGSNGSQKMTFRVNREGTDGVNNLKLDVLNAVGTTIGTIDIDRADPINKVYTLANGLQLTLGSGALIKDDDIHWADLSLLDTSFAPPYLTGRNRRCC